ncbi:hypothetical protein NDS46_31250 (plasmid) [Paenibacillus thiaminolyticus]|uniref:hypothetical protein n=1 Tax=Paenibacillus thiaminolyticus TaxID=49283 RepID=UPI00232B4681|nr:hypothetical protein [Paenibacillus thiaminolyticus]WCF11436.1 hypothetical protein NDS46_31250 [Paenibacillus thiaminolyticus]
MKSTVTVILSSNYGDFIPNRAYAKRLKQNGFEDWSSIAARTNQNVISFIKDHIEQSKYDFDVAFLGKTKDQFVILKDVQTDKPWSIANIKGSEFIRFFSYEVVDPKINYCREL